MDDKLDSVYRERNQLVAALSKHYPSFIGKHDGDHWEAAWLIVFIELPTGQVSWHTHASDLDLFEHLERRDENPWDGHTTEEKYDRLAQLPNVSEVHSGIKDEGVCRQL